MNDTKKIAGAILIGIFLHVPQHTHAKEDAFVFGAVHDTPTFRFTNANWESALHPKVASFTVAKDGSAYGMTETGIPFLQYNIPNHAGMRIQRFEIQDHYHYIINGKVAYTFAELSMRLSAVSKNS